MTNSGDDVKDMDQVLTTAQLIGQYFKDHPSASNQEVVNWLSDQDIQTTTTYVSQVKNKQKPSKKTVKKTRAKKAAVKKTKSTEAKERSAKKRAKGPRPFPAETLEECLKVPKVIRDLNGGNPWASSEVAKALEFAPKGNKFWYLTSSSQAYGLTIGTRDTEKIELDQIGKDYFYAPSPEVEAKSIKEAFFKIDIFKRVYEYYGGNNLPELKYLTNTLESEFGIEPEYHEDFRRIFRDNCDLLAKFSKDLPEDDSDANGKPNPAKSIIVGEPADKDSKVAFVIMPFSEKTGAYPSGFFGEVLKNLITPAGIEAGFKIETAKKSGSDIIQSTIINELLDADLVIADLTDHNPNVLFELGVRMAYDKPIALIRAEGTGQIFDVDNMLRVLDYNPNIWPSTLEHDLPKLTAHIKSAWDTKESENTYMKILRGERS